MMLRFQKITMWFLDSFFLRSNDVNKLPDSRNTFDMCRTNGTEPTSLRGVEWKKRTEEESKCSQEPKKGPEEEGFDRGAVSCQH